MANELISKALVEAQKNAKKVEKDSRNDFGKFNYASAEAIIEESRHALTSADLALVTLKWELQRIGVNDENTMLHVYYQLIHSSGEIIQFDPIPVPVVPHKAMPIDKAMASALTYCLSYFLRGLLLLPRVEKELEVDQRNDSDYQQGQQRNGKSKPPAKQEKQPPTGVHVDPNAGEVITENRLSDDQILTAEKWLEHIKKWREELDGKQTVSMLNTSYALIQKDLPKPVKKVVWGLFKEAAERSELVWDKENSMFVERKEPVHA